MTSNTQCKLYIFSKVEHINPLYRLPPFLIHLEFSMKSENIYNLHRVLLAISPKKILFEKNETLENPVWGKT